VGGTVYSLDATMKNLVAAKQIRVTITTRPPTT